MDSVDEKFMTLALEQASLAFQKGEVPVGAVITLSGDILAMSHNSSISMNDPSAHAEIIAIREAAMILDNYRLTATTLYVTLEPCPMCAGALVLARMDRLVYGCDDPKSGAVKSLYNIVTDDRLNHQLEVTAGVLADECAKLLQDFFQRRRNELKTKNL